MATLYINIDCEAQTAQVHEAPDVPATTIAELARRRRAWLARFTGDTEKAE